MIGKLQRLSLTALGGILLALAPVWGQFYEVKSTQKITANTGGFGSLNGGLFGWSTANIGDLDNDGVSDLAVSALNDNTNGSSKGAVYILFMNADGTVKSSSKIADNTGGFNVTLDAFARLGRSVAAIGDLDNDGNEDIAVGTTADNTGGSGRGAVYILFLNADGTVKSNQKIADNTGGFNVTLTNSDQFGHSIANLGDLDNDGVTDLAVSAFGDDTGGSGRGAVYILFMNADGTVKSNQKIADNTGGFNVTLANVDQFGNSVAGIGDLDGDGNEDLAVGANGDDTGNNIAGAAYILFLNADGTVKGNQKIASNTGGFNVTLNASDTFGNSVGNVGDLDGDGRNDIAVGANGDDTGNSSAGAAYILFLNADGTVKGNQKIASNTGGFGSLAVFDEFGYGIAGIGDLDGDGVNDIAATAGGEGDGTVYIIFSRTGNSDGTLTASATISEPVALPTTATASGSAVSIFDFTLSDGGTSDGKTLDITQINISLSGTGTASKLTFLLSGPDASDITGTISGSTLSFASLSISIANGSNETYTVKAYYNDTTGLTNNQTFILSLDGDTDLTLNGANTQMSGANAAVSNGTGSTVFIAVPQLSANAGARLSEHGNITLGNSLLKFTDSASTNAQIVYTLSSIPHFGQLQLSGSTLASGSTFTQDDLDNSRVSYVHLGGDEVFADGFDFTAKGSAGVSTSTFSFALAIDAVNDQPRIDVLQTLRLQEGETITITNGNLRALDSDHLGQQLSITLVQSPQYGQLNLGGFTQADIDQRRLTYRHDGSETTADRFVFTVTDAEGSARANIGIDFEITPVNDAPALPILNEQQATEGQAFTLAVPITDPEGDAFITALSGLPEGAVFADGTLSWTPSFAAAGRYGVTLTATDAHGAAGSRRFDLTVAEAGAPDLALAAVDFGAVDAGQTVEQTLTISNPTDLPLVIPAVEDAPADNRIFTMILPEATVTVPPRQQTQFKVRFSPRRDTPAQHTKTLVCPTNLGPITVPVAGSSRWSQLELNESLLDFGAVPLGGTKRLHVEAHNPGTAPLVVEDITCTHDGFSASPSSFTLAPGARRSLALTYAPTRQSRTAGLVRLMVEDQPSQVIAVQGAGRAAPAGFVHLDFDLGDRDQLVRRKDAVQVGDLIDVQVVIENAPAIEGWAARLAYDPAQLSYVAGSFAPSDFVPGLQGLADDTQSGLIEVGGAVLARSVAGPQSGAGRGALGTLRFRVENGFADAADLAVTRVRLRRVGQDGLVVAAVRSVATLSAAAADVQRLRPDFDGSDEVDFQDFFLFADAFGRPASGGAAPFDLDGSGAVDFADLFLFADAFGQAAPAGKRAALPLATQLQPGYPNPFNAETTLTYGLAAAGPVELAIYNLAGQRVQTLVAGERPAGQYRLVWDGRDEGGRAVASGRYFARFQAAGSSQIRGLTLLK